jgi:hypothetical protein
MSLNATAESTFPSHWKGELQNTDINENGHFMTEWLK